MLHISNAITPFPPNFFNLLCYHYFLNTFLWLFSLLSFVISLPRLITPFFENYASVIFFLAYHFQLCCFYDFLINFMLIHHQFSFGSSSISNNSFGGFSPWGEVTTTTTTPISRTKSSRTSIHRQNHKQQNFFPTTFTSNTIPSSSSSRNSNNNNLFSTSNRNMEFSEDPFKNYRYEDPFALSVDPFLSSSNHNPLQDNKADPFK